MMEHASCDDISDVKRAGYIEEEKEETERVSIGSRRLVGTVYTHGTPKSITSQSHQTASALALISCFSSTPASNPPLYHPGLPAGAVD